MKRKWFAGRKKLFLFAFLITISAAAHLPLINQLGYTHVPHGVHPRRITPGAPSHFRKMATMSRRARWGYSYFGLTTHYLLMAPQWAQIYPLSIPNPSYLLKSGGI